MYPESNRQRTHCIRCGQCCIASSPTLQTKDIPLIGGGLIERKNLYTIRIGELVRDPVQEKLTVAQREFIKIREKRDSGACIFYDEDACGCSIYEQRPLQCVAFACWDKTQFNEAYETPKAERRDIVRDKVLQGLIEAHEKRCSYAALETLVMRIEREGEKAIEKILELLRYDYHFRPFVSEKMAIDPEQMDFLFGRPFIKTIAMFGLKVIRKSDGSFLLTTSESPEDKDRRPIR